MFSSTGLQDTRAAGLNHLEREKAQYKWQVGSPIKESNDFKLFILMARFNLI